MKRSLLVGLFVWALLLPGGIVSAEGERLSLSFANAVEIGLSGNLDMRITQLTYDEAVADLDRALVVGDEDEIEAARERLETAKTALEDAKESLILDIEQRYVELLRAIDRFGDHVSALEDAERRHELEKARFQAGLISELALASSENTLFSAQQTFENQRESLATLRFTFNELLGIDLHTFVELTETIEVVFEPITLTLDEAVTIAFSHSESLMKARENLDEAREKALSTMNDYTPRAEREKAQNEVIRAEIALKKAENRTFLDTRSAYLTVKQREATVQLREAELRSAQANLKVAEAQFAADTISEETLRDRERALTTAERSLVDAIWDHISAKRTLLRIIGQPLTTRTS